MKMTDICKALGAAWSAMTDSQKAPYNKRNFEDKIRYEKELEQLEKFGYFINSKGEKSTDNFKPVLTEDVV